MGVPYPAQLERKILQKRALGLAPAAHLVRNDAYCGRRFSADGLQATWFVEEDQIKVHAQDGSVARVMSVEEAVRLASAAERRAA